MKKLKFLGLMFLTGLLTVSTACGGKADVAVTSITFDKENVDVVAGRSIDLKATVLPENATNKNLTWASSKEAVATVTSAGKVSALLEGECTITVASVSNPTVKATCKVNVLPVSSEWVISSVSRNKVLLDFDSNRAEKANKEEEFFIRDNNLVVGTDNDFCIRPSLEIYDEDDNKVSDDQWPYDYVVEVYKKNATGTFDKVDDKYYEVTDPSDASIQFKTTAEGSTFKIVITPGKEGGVKYKEEAKYAQEAIVDVVNGFNVVDALDFSVFDNREKGPEFDEYPTDSEADYGNPEGSFDTKWYEFKEERGIEGLSADNFVILGNISVTPDDIPAEFIYEENEDPKAIGSLKDPMYIYRRTAEGETKIYGNYFTLDYSQLPLIVRGCGHKSTETENRLDSHSTLLRLSEGDLTITDLNVVGNGIRAVKEEDKKYSGSLMFIKTHNMAGKVSMENVLCRKAYMTVMSEAPEDGYEFSADINYCKFYENYNSFLYNWGSEISCSNSIMKNAGGPVVIADHIVYEGFENDPVVLNPSEKGLYEVNGYVAKTSFTNCDLDSKVIGKEAWFDMMGATAITPQIKQLSDLIASKGVTIKEDGGHTKTYITAEDGTPVIGAYYQGTTVMSMISIGKSNAILGVSDLPCMGIAQFSYVDEDSNLQIDFKLNDLIGGTTPFYEFYRGIRNAGLPIFQTTGGFAVAVPSNPLDLESSTWSLFDLVEFALYYSGQTGAPTELNGTSDFFTKADNYIALIFQGLSITMKLYDMIIDI